MYLMERGSTARLSRGGHACAGVFALLISSAVSLEANAQTVLERVLADLGQIGTVSLIAANIAESATDAGRQGIIDGSIKVVATGVSGQVGDIVAATQARVRLGDLATTVLGATNTGDVFTNFAVEIVGDAMGAEGTAEDGTSVIGTADIVYGVNQSVGLAISGTALAAQRRIEAVGTAEGPLILALNSAANAVDISGEITVELSGVSAELASQHESIVPLVTSPVDLDGLQKTLGQIGTTAIGAVNGGTVMSGVSGALVAVLDDVVGQP